MTDTARLRHVYLYDLVANRHYAGMRQSPIGRWVQVEDYRSLLDRLAAAEKERDGWRAHCLQADQNAADQVERSNAARANALEEAAKVAMDWPATTDDEKATAVSIAARILALAVLDHEPQTTKTGD